MDFQESLKRYRIQIGMVLILLAAIYYKIVPSMIMQWSKDENYSHGFIVPIVAGYFLYTRWDDLKNTQAVSCNAGMVVIVAGLVQLLLGWIGAEYFTTRSSLIVLLAGLVLFFFGKRVFSISSLPIAYLFFMIPIPYIVYDMVAFPLKLFVTKASVATLRVLGVVVMREGNIIMFPATTLEVADACSGIRSLLSLIALAVAYAFFLRISPWKRFVLICSAIPIAIFTNAVRVIVTGVLAQWWGEKAAQGFFHEFAGMAVFAVAMILLVALGTLLGKGHSSTSIIQEEVEKFPHTETAGYGQTPGIGKFTVVCLMLFATAVIINFRQDISVPTNRPLQDFPTQFQSWEMSSDVSFSDAVLNVLKPTDYISRQYRSADGKLVSLYIGFHGGGKGTGEIHSPKHCLPGSGWLELKSTNYVLNMKDVPLNLVRGIYQKGENRELFIYWYQVRTKSVTSEYVLKFMQIFNSIVSSRRDASFIRISIPVDGDEQQSLAVGEKFIRDSVPIINGYLPK